MTTIHTENLLGGNALDAAILELAREAERVLHAVDAAGVAVHLGPAAVVAASGPLAAEVDAVQYRVGHGPCLQAFRTNAVVVLDLGDADHRWPDFQAAALDAGAGTVLSVPLRLDRRPVGSLNLYSRSRRAFSARAVREAELFARPAGLRLARGGVAVHAVEAAEIAGLELQDRAVIERALGVLMAAHRDGSLEHARDRLEEAARDLGLDVPLTAARIVAAPPPRAP